MRALLLFALSCSAPDGQDSLARRWRAEAQIPGEAMTLLLDIEGEGELVDARITVPAERVLGLQLEALEASPTGLSFRIPHPDHPMDFAGRVDGDSIAGALAMGGREMPLTFQRAGPVPGAPYREVEVSFEGAGRRVPGALLLPPGEGPHPALALFHATSASSRDYQRFYADLAARAGVAALIYDRRPVPADVARLRRADFLDVVADAEAAVRFLRQRGDVDGERVGVGGLSQGAWIAAMVATRVPEVAFVVALSCPGVPLHELDIYQSTRRLEAAGISGEALERALGLLVDLHAAARGECEDAQALGERLDRARGERWAAVLDLPASVPPPGSAAELLRWSASDLDPQGYFERLRVPVLLVFGGRDERLPSARCAERIQEALARCGNAAGTLLSYPEANHALFPAPGFESSLAEWLEARAARRAR